MYKTVSRNIIERFHYDEDILYLLIDEAYSVLSQNICEQYTETKVRAFSTFDEEHIEGIFDLPPSAAVLLLAEPQSYVRYKLYQYLDFSDGEPRIPGTNSRVLIFPVESLCHMFSAPVERDFAARDKLIGDMRSGQKYRITTEQGTDLSFEARQWIPLDFEICTAPVEESVNGQIVVDGALFFKKIDDPLIFTIKNGKLTGIEAVSLAGESLIEEYRRMTERDMTDPVNTQLAEIGIGFCSEAEISDCFMEAETVIDTCHFCFGNNVCYGGRNASEFHGASVLIKNPKFEIM